VTRTTRTAVIVLKHTGNCKSSLIFVITVHAIAGLSAITHDCVDIQSMALIQLQHFSL
jgi:hypothetical protein